MHPLIFLAVRSFLNGIKRAFSNVRRLIGVLFFFGYFGLILFRPFQKGPTFRRLSPSNDTLVIPPVNTVEPYIFAIFAVLSLFLSLGVFSGKVVHRAADVDVLFPTPINPKLVLAFNIVREFFFTLLMPFFFIVIGGRGSMEGAEYLFRNFPQYGNYFLRVGMGSWILLALMWTMIGFAVRLFLNRDWKKPALVRWAVALAVVGLPIFFIIILAFSLRDNFTGYTVTGALGSPLAKIAFWPATLATATVMAPLNSNLLYGTLGALGLLVCTGLGLWGAMQQATWMYDQAATRGNEAGNISSMQKKGDTFGVLAEYARQGKIKQNRISKWIAAKTLVGAPAFIWREAILQFRGGIWQYVALSIAAFALTGVATFGSMRISTGASYLFIIMQAASTFMLATAGAQIGFVETLKRVDVLKPLPYSPNITVFWEVISKAIPAALVVVLTSVVAGCFQPRLWNEAITLVFVLPSYSLLLSSTTMLSTLLFPDVDDPTQRGFRSFISMIAQVFGTVPGIICFFTAFALHIPLPWVIPVLVPLQIGLAFGLSFISGNFFANYNPSE